MATSPSAGRFRAWQQEEAHDSGRRRVPAPLLLHVLRLASCAYATSDFSLTATAPHSCHSASNCSADQRKRQLRRLNRPSTRLTLFGTVGLRRNHARRRTAFRSATPASLSTSTRSVRRMNRCQTSTAFARASARKQLPCLIRPKLLCRQPLQPLPDDSSSCSPIYPAVKAADPAHQSEWLNLLRPIRPIQSA